MSGVPVRCRSVEPMLPPGWWRTLSRDWWEELRRGSDVPVPVRPWSELEGNIVDVAASVSARLGHPTAFVARHAVSLWCFRPDDEKPSTKDLSAIAAYAERLSGAPAGWLNAVILYGCGVQRRTGDQGDSPWVGTWEPARLQFEAMVQDALGPGAEHRARRVVDMLLDGTCRCVDVAKAGTEATQAVLCGREHRASAWVVFDRTVSLDDLVARAIGSHHDLRHSGSTP